MSDPIITLTTDFGTRSTFVAEMKGVMLSINPAARLVDLSHDIPPFDIRHAAFFLAEALPNFPPEAIHLVVVDPDGGSRNGLLANVGGQRIVGPDNGCWTLFARGREGRTAVVSLDEPAYWRASVSPTFLGRDVFAPVAAHLSLGVDPVRFGSPLKGWREFAWPTPAREERAVIGEVVFVDHFGNLISNIPGTELPATGRVIVAGCVVRVVRTFADAPAGEVVGLVCSCGLVGAAVVRGSTAAKLGLGIGALFRIEWT